MAVDRMWRSHDLKRQYDIVIIAAGVHGLAIAYYLAKRGVTNAAVLDQGDLGGGSRHDAVVWGYARGADRQGAEIHPFTEVTGIQRSNGRITGVVTPRGTIAAGVVVNATAGWCSAVAHLAGVELPIVTHPLQA